MADARSLKPDKYTTLVLDGQLRETVGYDILSDAKPARWDSIANGRQIAHSVDDVTGKDLGHLRAEALQAIEKRANTYEGDYG